MGRGDKKEGATTLPIFKVGAKASWRAFADEGRRSSTRRPINRIIEGEETGTPITTGFPVGEVPATALFLRESKVRGVCW